MNGTKQNPPSRHRGPAWLYENHFAPPAATPSRPDPKQDTTAVPSSLDFQDYNKQCWQQLSERDYAYLTGPRSYPSSCPWCGGRLIHAEACEELRASWELVMPYGKHKGRRISELPLDYLDWLRRQPGLLPELRAAIEQHC